MSFRLAYRRHVIGVSALAGLSVSLVLSGCSSSSKPAASQSATSSPAATASAAASSAAPSSGGSSPAASSAAVAPASSAAGGGSPASDISATISVSMQQTDIKTGDPTTYALVQAFEQKYPNIKVNLSGQPVAQHDQTIDVGAQSHTLPDIFWVQSADTGSKLAKSGALLDLTPILQSGGIADKIAPATLAEFKTGNLSSASRTRLSSPVSITTRRSSRTTDFTCRRRSTSCSRWRQRYTRRASPPLPTVRTSPHSACGPS